MKLRYLDLDGAKQEIEAEGLLATCLQHEIDHLDGVLFIDHISALKRNMLLRKLAKDLKSPEGVATDAARLHGQPGFRGAGAAGAAGGRA